MDNLLYHVDIETTGPAPGVGSLIAIGAIVHDPITNELGDSFSINVEEVFPRDTNTMTEFWQDHVWEWEQTRIDPLPAHIAMTKFSDWIRKTGTDRKRVFVADPVGFDWGFINYYFWNYHGTNPLGYSPRCIASYLQGVLGDTKNWNLSRSAGSRDTVEEFTVKPERPHIAISDAIAQARTLMNIINHIRTMN